MGKVKKFFLKWCNARRYRDFKGCSLPYFFYDENYEYAKWLTYNEKQKNFEMEASLFEALGNVAHCGLTYDFVAFLPVLPTKEDSREYKTIESHCHSFEEVVRVLYQSPKSFYIPRKYLYEYSEQELRYLSRLQSYLLAVGLQDKESMSIQKIHQKWRYLAYKKHLSFKERWQFFLLNHSKKIDKIAKQENLERCSNAKALIYQNYIPLYLKNLKLVKYYLSGEIDYLVLEKYSFFSSPLKQRYFIMNFSQKIQFFTIAK